nr:MAG TPA: hypothetical protein [Herelleviridae sp.]
MITRFSAIRYNIRNVWCIIYHIYEFGIGLFVANRLFQQKNF